MNFRECITGINIQFPISQRILSGEKSIETRLYPLPEKYVNQELLLIETPGHYKFKARAIATIMFGKPFCYSNAEEFYGDFVRHCVAKDSVWGWKDGKLKWGWPIISCVPFSEPANVACRKGIVFTNNLRIVNSKLPDRPPEVLMRGFN